MTSKSYWRKAARQAIDQALDSIPPGVDPTAAIDAAYPFGMREYTPYKVWLEERRLTLQILGYWKSPKARPGTCKWCRGTIPGCLVCKKEKKLTLLALVQEREVGDRS